MLFKLDADDHKWLWALLKRTCRVAVVVCLDTEAEGCWGI